MFRSYFRQMAYLVLGLLLISGLFSGCHDDKSKDLRGGRSLTLAELDRLILAPGVVRKAPSPCLWPRPRRCHGTRAPRPSPASV